MFQMSSHSFQVSTLLLVFTPSVLMCIAQIKLKRTKGSSPDPSGVYHLPSKVFEETCHHLKSHSS